MPLLLLLVAMPASAQPLSDKTGLVYNLNIDTGGHIFEVKTTSTFDIQEYFFDKDQKRLTLHVVGNIENNLGEILLPQNLIGGNLTVYLNGQEHPVNIRSNEQIFFITLNFTGLGDHQIDIVAETYLGKTLPVVSEPVPEPGGGCLIATAVYGSELAPQVQFLRELRDSKIMGTDSGAAFMNQFNQLYYSFSPHVADYQRENSTFNEMVRLAITPLVTSLGIMSLAESEHEVLSYGATAVLFNAGIYLAAPAMAYMCLRRAFTR